LDTYDIGAGLWLEQLEQLIEDAGTMLMIISPSYESGNISELEIHQAIIRSRRERSFVPIPALFSHEPKGFLSAFSWADFREYRDNGLEESFDKGFNRLLYLLSTLPNS